MRDKILTKQNWQDEFEKMTDLLIVNPKYGYYCDVVGEEADKQIKSFITRTRKQAQEEILDKVKIGKACGVDKDRTTKCWCRLKAIENYEAKIKKLKGL